MKRRITILITCALLFCTAVSCSDTKGNSSSDNTAETTTAAETVAEQTTETQTEPTTEPATKAEVEYYDGLICSDTMTDKEKENSSFREITLFSPEKGFSIGWYRWSVYPDESAMKKIQDNVRELKMYDEQLDENFLVHIILPPDYDENREYPVYLITDAVSWISRVPKMWNIIKDGEASPVIFVTLGYDYDVDYGDTTRFNNFILYQDKFLDFITNDLMGAISLNYRVDASRSVFFGHSWGGLFADYALFHSDKYDKQPFANYIIGSSAFWTMGSKEYWDEFMPEGYDESIIAEHMACNSDYDYFERHETLDKNVWVCAGGREPDLNTIGYNGGDNVIDNVRDLYERLIAHGVNAELKIYEDRYHNNYVEDMLKEYLKQTYPPIN